MFQAGEDGDEPGGHRNYISPALQTGLCDWSAKYFAQPVMKVLLLLRVPHTPGLQIVLLCVHFLSERMCEHV